MNVSDNASRKSTFLHLFPDVTAHRSKIASVASILLVVSAILAASPIPAGANTAQQAKSIVEASGIQGGLVVHVGCGDGTLTTSLRVNDRYVVQGLTQNREQLQAARKFVKTRGLAGPVSIKTWHGGRLPYADNLVNLLVLTDQAGVTQKELERVLAPGGVMVRVGPSSLLASPFKKTWPDEMDQWTHYLHGPTNNAVAHDSFVGPPHHFQWTCGPRFSRSHDHLASMSAMVSAGGRVFFLADMAPAAFAGATARWHLLARDAFSGIALWDREIKPWEYHLRDFRSGPADIARRLVAVDDRVYVTLGYGKPVTALDAATGQIVRTYAGTEAAQEILVSDGKLYVVLGDRDHQWRAQEAKRTVSQEDYVPSFERTTPPTRNKRIVVVDAESGKVIWKNEKEHTRTLMPTTLAVDDGRVYFQSTEAIICLDGVNGQKVWEVKQPIQRRRLAWSSPTIVVHDGIVYAADRQAIDKDGALLWIPSGGYHEYIRGEASNGQLVAYNAKTGNRLWSCPAHEGFNSAVDIMIADGLLWTGNYCWGNDPGITEARDPKTGEVVRRRAPDTDFLPRIGHARCHRAKATDQFLILGRRGVEFVDVKSGKMIANRWVRGMCQYGVMPANGLLYVPPHSCACSINEMLKSGYMALAPQRAEQSEIENTDEDRLLRGPAYGSFQLPVSNQRPGQAWPTYRADARRSGITATTIPHDVAKAWSIQLGGQLTSPVVGSGLVLVARPEAHEICAVNERAGTVSWCFQTSARIDSPPTIYGDSALFGSADGYVYCVRLIDGELVWRFRAAPSQQQIVVDNQLESAWPISGSVLLVDGAAYFAVGRTSHLDGGMSLYKLDAATGEILKQVTLSVEQEVRDGGLAGKGQLPDVLSCDGTSIFMRDARYDLDLVPQKADVPHLYSPVGFLDAEWWHRTYWQIGTSMKSGWGGWSKAGQQNPAGRLLVTDGERVYGWGRDQYDTPGAHVGVDADGVWGPIAKQYGRWTYLHLFGQSIDTRPPRQQRREAQVADSTGWSRRVPVLGRALLLDSKSLLVAGPIDPLQTVPHQPEAADRLTAALESTRGGQLLMVRPGDGQVLAKHDLHSPPVFDGMAAAQGKLFIAACDGSLFCLAGKESYLHP